MIYFSLKMRHASPLYFEDIVEGMTFEFSPFEVTQEMRDRHVAMYSEDWPEHNLDHILKEGIVPSHLVISYIAGQGGASDWMKVLFAKSYECKFFCPAKVGDILKTFSEVIGKKSHKNPEKNYGYVSIRQDIKNQREDIVYQRFVDYLVEIKGITLPPQITY